MSEVTVSTQGLRKVLKLPQIIALYIGSVIGSGILLIPGMAAEVAGPASIVAWLAMSILVVPMAVTMGLLASKYPSAGGVSHFARVAFGAPYGNLVGWFFFLSVPLGGPVLAVTGAQYIGVLLHLGHDQVYAVAAILLMLPIVVNLFGLKLAGKVQTVVIAMLLAILLLAIFAAMPHQSMEHFTPFVPHGWLSVAQAAGLLFWCFIVGGGDTSVLRVHRSGKGCDSRRAMERGHCGGALLRRRLLYDCYRQLRRRRISSFLEPDDPAVPWRGGRLGSSVRCTVHLLRRT